MEIYKMEPLNDLTILLALYPDKEWNIETLSLNPNISMKFISSHPEIHWNGLSFLRNPNITIDIAKNIIHANRHSILLYDYLEYLSFNPNISWKNITNNRDIKWDRKTLSKNPNITWSTIQKYNNIFQLNYAELFSNPNISPKIFNRESIRKYISYYVCNSQKIDWEIIRPHLDHLRDHAYVLTQYLPIDIILNNLNLSELKGEDGWGNTYRLSMNRTVTWEIVTSHPEIKWDYEELAANPGITWENIISNPLFDNILVSLNPNISWKNVYEHQNRKWKHALLSGNTFGYRSYSWSEFLGDLVVEDTVKEKVLKFHQVKQNIRLILAIYNPNHPNYNRLVGDYFTQNYSNLEFDLQFDLSLPLKEIMKDLETYVKIVIGKEILESQEYLEAKKRFGKF